MEKEKMLLLAKLNQYEKKEGKHIPLHTYKYLKLSLNIFDYCLTTDTTAEVWSQESQWKPLEYHLFEFFEFLEFLDPSFL